MQVHTSAHTHVYPATYTCIRVEDSTFVAFGPQANVCIHILKRVLYAASYACIQVEEHIFCIHQLILMVDDWSCAFIRVKDGIFNAFRPQPSVCLNDLRLVVHHASYTCMHVKDGKFDAFRPQAGTSDSECLQTVPLW